MEKRLTRRPNVAVSYGMPVLPQERQIMQVAAARKFPFRVLGVAPAPVQPVFTHNWWLVPATDDHSQIPARAMERVQAIYAAGIHPKAFVIAHEAPAQIAAPRGTPVISPFEFWARKMGEHSQSALQIVSKAVTIATPVLMAALGVGLLVSIGLAGAILTDPCLIAVTEDDVWIEIDSWMS